MPRKRPAIAQMRLPYKADRLVSQLLDVADGDDGSESLVTGMLEMWISGIEDERRGLTMGVFQNPPADAVYLALARQLLLTPSMQADRSQDLVFGALVDLEPATLGGYVDLDAPALAKQMSAITGRRDLKVARVGLPVLGSGQGYSMAVLRVLSLFSDPEMMAIDDLVDILGPLPPAPSDLLLITVSLEAPAGLMDLEGPMNSMSRLVGKEITVGNMGPRSVLTIGPLFDVAATAIKFGLDTEIIDAFEDSVASRPGGKRKLVFEVSGSDRERGDAWDIIVSLVVDGAAWERFAIGRIEDPLRLLGMLDRVCSMTSLELELAMPGRVVFDHIEYHSPPSTR